VSSRIVRSSESATLDEETRATLAQRSSCQGRRTIFSTVNCLSWCKCASTSTSSNQANAEHTVANVRGCDGDEFGTADIPKLTASAPIVESPQQPRYSRRGNLDEG
jgi:hypothetical protein